MRWHGIRQTFAGLLEGRLPGYLWYLPRELTRRHPQLLQMLKKNAHRLTTPLDVYATLRGVLEDFKLLDAPSTQPFLVAKAVVRDINRILKPYAQRCARLSLQRVEGAYAHTVEDPKESSSFGGAQWGELYTEDLKVPGSFLCFGTKIILKKRETDSDTEGPWSSDVREYTVSLVTTPGGAVFEAMARVFDGAVTVMGEVLRTSLYGNSSHCVPTMPYRKFCYCLQPASPS
ncbi:hypothetical protein HPB52_020236 [Rhipicephalus sanguineus]|uniref:Uncharacterized protein n=1 Tax=Rhipicephalus sanguineus TaxID=34632 RepID=A0A9D4T0D0_RHISA|nr:hypothetical protein HPB52_020236 [Rhipicephalus sanguineus]